MFVQQPQTGAQVHYKEPFSRHVTAGLLVMSVLLVIGIIVAAIVPSGDQAMSVAAILLVTLWSFEIILVLVTNPSVGLVKRQILPLSAEGPVRPIYTVKPLFGRKKCEQTGGLHMSNFHGYVVDFNAPYVQYTCFGKEFRVRWQPAVLVVDW